MIKNVFLFLLIVCGSLYSEDPKPTKVIVVGAGIAGLSCAYELQQKGFDVTVLEAQNRPGGRIYTLRKPFEENQYAEAGAVFITASETRTLKYIEQFGIPLSVFPESESVPIYFFRGQKFLGDLEISKIQLPAGVKISEEEKKFSVLQLIFKYVGPAMRELGDVTQPNWPPEQLKKYDAMTFAQFLKKAGASEGAIQLIRLGYFDLWGNGIDQTSALWILRDMSFAFRPGGAQTMKGGNDQLPKAFAALLKDHIFYNSPVKQIEQDGEGVRVIFSDSSGKTQTLQGDYAVITIPFPVLKNIPFSPPLPPEKQFAIENLAFTSVTRFCVQTKGDLLKKAGIKQMGYGDLPALSWFRNVTFNQPGNLEIFESYMAGPQARKIDAMKNGEENQLILTDIEKLLPGIKNQVVKTVTYSWGNDPWERGAYPWCSPGQMFSILPYVATSVGRIHFAGDHTSPYPGWIEGALLSAERVISEITNE